VLGASTLLLRTSSTPATPLRAAPLCNGWLQLGTAAGKLTPTGSAACRAHQPSGQCVRPSNHESTVRICHQVRLHLAVCQYFSLLISNCGPAHVAAAPPPPSNVRVQATGAAGRQPGVPATHPTWWHGDDSCMLGVGLHDMLHCCCHVDWQWACCLPPPHAAPTTPHARIAATAVPALSLSGGAAPWCDAVRLGRPLGGREMLRNLLVPTRCTSLAAGC
jgi:hypothetical protein